MMVVAGGGQFFGLSNLWRASEPEKRVLIQKVMERGLYEGRRSDFGIMPGATWAMYEGLETLFCCSSLVQQVYGEEGRGLHG